MVRQCSPAGRRFMRPMQCRRAESCAGIVTVRNVHPGPLRYCHIIDLVGGKLTLTNASPASRQFALQTFVSIQLSFRTEWARFLSKRNMLSVCSTGLMVSPWRPAMPPLHPHMRSDQRGTISPRFASLSCEPQRLSEMLPMHSSAAPISDDQELDCYQSQE